MENPGSANQPPPEIAKLLQEAQTEYQIPNHEEEELAELAAKFHIEDVFHEETTPPCLLFKGVKLIHEGQFAVISSAPGVGKSNLIDTIIAAFVAMKRGISCDTAGFSFPDLPGKALLVDMEQHKAAVYKSYERTCFRLGKNPKDFDVMKDVTYCLHNYVDMSLYVKLLEYQLQKHQYSLLVIDGIAHYCPDINDPKQAPAFVMGVLSKLVAKHNLLCIVTAHTNKEKDVIAGTLGTKLIAYSRAHLLLKKDDAGVRFLTSNFSVGKLSNDSGSVTGYFDYQPLEGRTDGLLLSSGAEPVPRVISHRETELEQMLRQVMPTSGIFYKGLPGLLRNHFGVSENTARRYVEKAQAAGLIDSNGQEGVNRAYKRINPNDDSVPF